MSWVKLAAATASSSANVQIDNVFTTDYIAYRIVPDLETETGASLVDVRLRASGTSSTSSLYTFQYSQVTNATDATARVNNNTNWNNVMGQVEIGTRLTPVDFMLFNPAQTVETTFAAWYVRDIGAALPGMRFQGGIYEATTSFDGIDLFATNPVTGTVYIYGLSRQ